MMKIAYSGKPHLGGTYTVFRLLREGLAQHNIELRWVNLVDLDYTLPPSMEEETNFGEFIYREQESKDSATKFAKHIEDNYDGIIFNVLTNSVETNTARYISNNILKLQIVHNITPATYLAAKAISDYVHGTICPTPRISNDLINNFKLTEKNVVTIPHAVNLNSFFEVKSKFTQNSLLKLLYVGRIEESAKGVFWLLEILQECSNNGTNASLTVVGDGRDLEQLKLKTDQMGLHNQVEFYGKASHQEIPHIFASHQIFVMPSRYEGFGYSLVEAMASGCVPVCSQINGVTDFIVSDEEPENGCLFPIGDTKQAASHIKKLANQTTWQQFSDNAKIAVESRFTLTKQAESYADLIERLKSNTPEIAPPLSLENWEIPSGLKPRWATYLPDSVKNLVRVWREKVKVSI